MPKRAKGKGGGEEDICSNRQETDYKLPKIRGADYFRDNRVWESQGLRGADCRLTTDKGSCLSGLPTCIFGALNFPCSKFWKATSPSLHPYSSLHPCHSGSLSPSRVSVALLDVCWQWCARQSQGFPLQNSRRAQQLWTWKYQNTQFMKIERYYMSSSPMGIRGKHQDYSLQIALQSLLIMTKKSKLTLKIKKNFKNRLNAKKSKLLHLRRKRKN